MNIQLLKYEVLLSAYASVLLMAKHLYVVESEIKFDPINVMCVLVLSQRPPELISGQ